MTAYVVDLGQFVRSRDQLPSIAMAKRVAGFVCLGTGGVARAEETPGRTEEVGIGRRDLVRYRAVEDRQGAKGLVLGHLVDLVGGVEFAGRSVGCELLIDQKGEG